MGLRRTACCLIIVAGAAGAEPLVLHVSPDGNDAWNGRSATATAPDGPFATPARARDALRQARAAGAAGRPVQVVLHGGTYHLAEPLAFAPEDGGSATAPVTWMAAAGEHPVLSGGRPLGGWTVKEGRWIVTVPPVAPDQRGPRRLSVDGNARYRPILPKQGYFRVAGFAGLDPKAKYDTPADRFEYRSGDLDPSWRNPTDIEAVVLHFWVDTHLPLAAIDDQRHVVSFSLKSRRRLTDDFNANGARYYLANVAEALREPGEFYWDRSGSTVTYLPKAGEDALRSRCELPVLTHLVDIAGGADGTHPVEHLRFQDLAFTCSQWSLPAKDAGDLQAANSVPGAVRIAFAHDLAFHRCTFTNLATYGLAINAGCRDIAITRCEFAHLDAGGIRVNGGDDKSPAAQRTGGIAVEDCHLHDLGEAYHSAVGLLFMHADHCRLVHNHVHQLRYSSISVGWVWGYGPSVSVSNLVEGNDLHDIGLGMLSDMGGIYTLGDGTGTVVRHNRIYNVDSWGYGGWGLYTDEGSRNIVLEDNLVYRTKCASFHQHYGRENILRNNILAFAREDQLQRTRKEKHLSYTFERNIVYWDPGQNLLGKSPANWDDDQYALDHNCYWLTGGGAVRFAKWSFAEWRERGKDVHSLIKDPLFADAAHGDFRLPPDSPALQVGFKPFDLTTFGVRPER